MEAQITNILQSNMQIFENNQAQNLTMHKWTSLPQGLNPLPIDIQEKKPFIKTKKGWQWFKNLVIPTIRVFPKSEKALKEFQNSQSSSLPFIPQSMPFLQKIENISDEEEENEKNNTDKMENSDSKEKYLGRFDCFKKLNNNTFEPVELQGNQFKELSNLNLAFKSLKFEETSFMTRSQYFLIVVTIYENSSQQIIPSKIPQITNVFVSPQLSVDARKKYWSERQAQVSIFDPFLPSLADKQYEKVSKKDGNRQMVGDDLQGLENYFTSYSIRHKIRNPFFLLFKFPYGVKLYFNTDHVTPTDNQEQLLTLIHKQIFKCFMHEQEEDLPKTAKPLLLCLNAKDDDLSVKESVSKINKFLNTLEGPALTYSPYIVSQVPENFTQLNYTNSLKECYKKVYNRLLTLKFQIKDEEAMQQQNSMSQSDNNKQQYQTVIQTNNKLGTIIDLQIKNPQYREKCLKIKAQKLNQAGNNSPTHEPQIKKLVKSNPNIDLCDSMTRSSTKNTFTQLHMSKLNISSLTDIPDLDAPAPSLYNIQQLQQQQQQQIKFEHAQELYMHQLHQQYLLQQQQQQQQQIQQFQVGSLTNLPSQNFNLRQQQNSMPFLFPRFAQSQQQIITEDELENRNSNPSLQQLLIQQQQQQQKINSEGKIASLCHIPSLTDIKM